MTQAKSLWPRDKTMGVEPVCKREGMSQAEKGLRSVLEREWLMQRFETKSLQKLSLKTLN